MMTISEEYVEATVARIHIPVFVLIPPYPVVGNFLSVYVL